MSNYGIDDIESLTFVEGVRKRIPMYLGTADTEGIYQALKEVINNSTDEALMGFGNVITICVDEKRNFISVEDKGRGIPFGKRANGENVLVSIFSKAHTGGKFDNKSYTSSSGLNGIGIKATCLSSEYFKAISKRDNKQATIIFEKGKLISYEETAAKDSVSGTYIEFIPDKEVFKGMEEGFSFKRICEETKNISFLNKKIHFLVKNLQTNESFDYYSENGIADFIKDKVKNPLMKSPIIVHKTDGTDEVEVAFMWTADSQASYVFANGLSCPQGGSPITAAKRTFTTQIKKLSGRDFDPELIRKGLVYAINCKVREPLFANQTKSSITNKNLGTLTSAALKEGLEDFSRTEDFGAIIEMMTKIQKAENAADKAREAALNRNKKMTELRKQKVAFIDKLSDAEYLGEDSILCLVEGDSGGEAVAVGRDTAKYGVMRLKGKMLNGIKEDNDEKYFNNKEIELLIYALGIDVGHYDPKKLRYGKIAICVDSDK